MTKAKTHRVASIFSRRGGRWANRDLSKCGRSDDHRYQPSKDRA